MVDRPGPAAIGFCPGNSQHDMDKVTMDVCPYKGYEIHAVPHQLVDTGDWTIDIQISHETEGGKGWRHFSDGNCFKTREEAIAHCFNFGKQIIDGKFENYTVADL